VWALDTETGLASQISSDGTVNWSVLVGLAPSGIEYAGGAVWVSDPAGRTVTRLGPDGQVLARASPAEEPSALATKDDVILLVDAARGSILTLDDVAEVIGEVRLPTAVPGPNGRQPPGAPGAMLVADDDIWLAFPEPGVVVRMTMAGEAQDFAAVSPGPVSLAFGRGELWVAAETAASVTRVAPDGRVIETIETGGTPTGIAYDGQSIWVAVDGFDQVVRITP
jgi:sugar lactone lactonase YvrE